MSGRRAPHHFTDDFKAQMVSLYNSGKPFREIISEYDLTVSSLRCWINQSKNSGSFQEADNRTPEENELIELRKENQLKMENDILKQAALIIGRK